MRRAWKHKGQAKPLVKDTSHTKSTSFIAQILHVKCLLFPSLPILSATSSAVPVCDPYNIVSSLRICSTASIFSLNFAQPASFQYSVNKQDTTVIKIEDRELSMDKTSGITQGCTGTTILFKWITFKKTKKYYRAFGKK